MTTAQPEGGSTGGPTVLRMLLGAHLRRLREAQGVSRETAGWEIRSSESKISRMELGRVSFKERDVADLLTLYGVSDAEERAALLTLARDANTPGWWHREGDILPGWFQSYLGLESAAAVIRTYELQFVPGLLQTADYARAVILLGHGKAVQAELDRRVSLRMTRQQLLNRPDPPQLWAVIDEGALRRPVGGPDVMRAQLEALIDATKMPNVRLQIIPFELRRPRCGRRLVQHPAVPGPGLAGHRLRRATGPARCISTSAKTCEHYAAAMERLAVEADPPADTPERLERFLAELNARTG